MSVEEFLEQLQEAEAQLGVCFRERGLLLLALTHSSYSNEVRLNRPEHNERLEFLGDAVLELIVSAELYARYPKLREGELTKLRAKLVCEQSLAACARAVRLGEFLRLGKGEAASGGRERDSVLSDAFEAVIGALYLDGGQEKARAFVLAQLPFETDGWPVLNESKSRLQEWAQKRGGQVEYLMSTVLEDGKQLYDAVASFNGKAYGKGRGATKKAAQQEAAYRTLLQLGRQ